MGLVIVGCGSSEAQIYNATRTMQCLATNPGFSNVPVDLNTPTKGLPFTFSVRHIVTRMNPTNDRVHLLEVKFAVHPDADRAFDWYFDVSYFPTLARAKRYYARWRFSNTRFPGAVRPPIGNVVMQQVDSSPGREPKPYYRLITDCLKT